MLRGGKDAPILFTPKGTPQLVANSCSLNKQNQRLRIEGHPTSNIVWVL